MYIREFIMNKTKMITIRLSASEYVSLKEHVATSGKSASQLFREHVLERNGDISNKLDKILELLYGISVDGQE